MGSINVLDKENNIVNVNNNVENMIYEIRGVQVMLSSDVAKLYQVETRRIKLLKEILKDFLILFVFN